MPDDALGGHGTALRYKGYLAQPTRSLVSFKNPIQLVLSLFSYCLYDDAVLEAETETIDRPCTVYQGFG